MAVFSLRLKDPEYKKIKTIAEIQGRSINKQIEQIVFQYIKDYEKTNGRVEEKQLKKINAASEKFISKLQSIKYGPSQKPGPLPYSELPEADLFCSIASVPENVPPFQACTPAAPYDCQVVFLFVYYSTSAKIFKKQSQPDIFYLGRLCS